MILWFLMTSGHHGTVPSEKQPVEFPNGLYRWFRIEVLAFVLQSVIIIGGIIYGYSKLEGKVDELNRRVTEHIEKHNVYLLRDTWEVRNRFIDQKLDSIERKLDLLLIDRDIAKKK